MANKTNRPSYLRRHKLISGTMLLLALILLSIPAYFVYEKVALELNRRAFVKARLAIDTAYADIVTQAGQPYSHQSTNSCERGYINDWEQVTTCSVDINFKYKVASQSESDSLDSRIVSIISKSKYLKPTADPYPDNQITLAPGAKPDTSVHWYKSPGRILCSYRHVYGTDTEAVSDFHLSLLPNDFYASFDCTGSASQPYYRLDS